jgi:hypothetical protein
MNFALLERLARARQERAAAAPGGTATPPAPRPRSGPIDLLVTHNEVSDRHGTGVLLRRLFLGSAPIASVRAVDLYGGEQDLGTPRLRLSLEGAGWPDVMAGVIGSIGHLDVRRILCVPYSPVDVQVALAAREIFGAPLCTWVMDDQNITANGLPDELLRRLFDRSRLLLAIGPELADAYRAKFRRHFVLAPPVVTSAHVQARPCQPDPARLAARRGLVFGNIWGERWLERLLTVLSGSGITLEWHSTGGTPWYRIDEDHLVRAGLRVRPRLLEQELVDTLRATPFVVIASGALDSDDSHEFVARLSLPSRIPYAAATAGAPLVVLGHPETAAARFVARHGLGVTAPYERRAFTTAVDEICRPEVQARCRAAAATLAPVLSAQGMVDWIWRSLEAGRPIDRRFESLENHA